MVSLESRKMELQLYTFGNEVVGEHTITDVKKKIKKFKGKKVSIGERVVIALLEEKGVYYKVEQVFDDSKKRFDFYLPTGIDNQSPPLVIEVNGAQHYNSNSFYGNSSHESDAYKETYCSKHNIELVFLDCSKSSIKYITESISNNTLLCPLLDGVKVKNAYRKYFNKDFRKLSMNIH